MIQHILFQRSDLSKSISQITDKVLENVRDGSNVVILSDKAINKEKAAVPIQILVSNIHNSLIENGLRMKVSIIVESGEVKEDHHVCCLLGYGASAVYPYLAFESAKRLDV